MTISEKLIVLSKINDMDRLRLGILLVLDELDAERNRISGGWLDSILSRDMPINPDREAA